MTLDEIAKNCYRPYVRGICETIKLRDELGQSLRPSRLLPVGTRGPNVTVDFSEEGLQARDRVLSPGRIDWLKSLRSDFPEVAAEFSSVLAKAERVWIGCIET
jgi:hypothetical protein